MLVRLNETKAFCHFIQVDFRNGQGLRSFTHDDASECSIRSVRQRVVIEVSQGSFLNLSRCKTRRHGGDTTVIGSVSRQLSSLFEILYFLSQELNLLQQ